MVRGLYSKLMQDVQGLNFINGKKFLSIFIAFFAVEST